MNLLNTYFYNLERIEQLKIFLSSENLNENSRSKIALRIVELESQNETIEMKSFAEVLTEINKETIIINT